MGGLLKFENQSPSERKKACSQLLNLNSPDLLEEGIEFFRENANAEDTTRLKLAWKIWEKFMDKALPNQTKHEIETTTKADPQFLAFKEKQRIELAKKRIEGADYEVLDD